MELYDIFLDCIDKWAKKEFDNRLEEAIDRFEEWEGDFDKDEGNIVSNLLKRFSYYSKKEIQDILKDLSDNSIERFGISNQDSVISVVRKTDGKLNSSYEYWMLHRMESGLSKKIYFDSIDGIDDTFWENIRNVVYVDDCSGTGVQFVEFLKRQKKSLLNKHVILIVIEIMKEAKDYIFDYATQNSIYLDIIFYAEKDKAFKESKNMERDIFVKLSEKHEINKSYIMGFKQAEALMAFYNNSPNDTLGIFWLLSKKNKPIFEREIEEEPGWKQISKGKIGEESNNMRQKQTNPNLKYQELLILAYFKANYKEYEFNEIVRMMGMTNLEVGKALDYLLEMEYLACIEGYIVITRGGEKILSDNNLEKFFLLKFDEMLDKKQWNIDKPYVPIGFEI